MKKMFNFIYRIFKLPNLAHEVLHYLPAQYWNLNPQIAEDWLHIMSDRTTNTRRMVIVLMPAFVGLLFFPLVLSMIVHQTVFYIAASLFWVGWMLGCGKDLYKAGYFLIFKKWHNQKDET